MEIFRKVISFPVGSCALFYLEIRILCISLLAVFVLISAAAFNTSLSIAKQDFKNEIFPAGTFKTLTKLLKSVYCSESF